MQNGLSPVVFVRIAGDPVEERTMMPPLFPGIIVKETSGYARSSSPVSKVRQHSIDSSKQASRYLGMAEVVKTSALTSEQRSQRTPVPLLFAHDIQSPAP